VTGGDNGHSSGCGREMAAGPGELYWLRSHSALVVAAFAYIVFLPRSATTRCGHARLACRSGLSSSRHAHPVTRLRDRRHLPPSSPGALFAISRQRRFPDVFGILASVRPLVMGALVGVETVSGGAWGSAPSSTGAQHLAGEPDRSVPTVLVP